MGPYCDYCGTRCFVPLPKKTPAHMLAAYGTSSIVATCPGGKRFERTKVGYCLDDIYAAIAKGEPQEPELVERTPEQRHEIALADFCYHLKQVRCKARDAIAMITAAVCRLEELLAKAPAPKDSATMTAADEAELLGLTQALDKFTPRNLRADVRGDLHQGVIDADYAIGALEDAQQLLSYLERGDFTS